MLGEYLLPTSVNTHPHPHHWIRISLGTMVWCVFWQQNHKMSCVRVETGFVVPVHLRKRTSKRPTLRCGTGHTGRAMGSPQREAASEEYSE